VRAYFVNYMAMFGSLEEAKEMTPKAEHQDIRAYVPVEIYEASQSNGEKIAALLGQAQTDLAHSDAAYGLTIGQHKLRLEEAVAVIERLVNIQSNRNNHGLVDPSAETVQEAWARAREFLEEQKLFSGVSK